MTNPVMLTTLSQVDRPFGEGDLVERGTRSGSSQAMG
jgi:hypothetical protein